MTEAWNVLSAAGLPLGGAGPRGGRVEWGAVRAALAVAVDEAGRDAWLLEPLVGWLRAFRQHWPEKFARALGPDGDAALASLEALPLDANRYLKLRRIALDNLARVW